VSRDFSDFPSLLKSLLYLLRIPIGYLHALVLILIIRPNTVLAFGSFITSIVVPVAAVLKFTGCKIFLHEQTVHFSLSSKVGDIFSDRTFLSFPRRMYANIKSSKGKYFFVGNLLRKEIFSVERVNLNTVYGFNDRNPVVFVAGGKQGSLIVSQKVLETAEKSRGVNFIVQAGENSISIFEGRTLPNLKAFKSFGSTDMLRNVANSDLIISRAGANTVHEVIYLGKRAIFIPLKGSRGNEQYKNALFAKATIGAEVIEQDQIDRLGTTTEEVLASQARLDGIDTPGSSRGVKNIQSKYRSALENFIFLCNLEK
jgi:UDP-N-acetylglucosamine--N-acetylmuramyl-(pentapeptide) pyrophosphoryl-undecaprenol N-acetylglucosamine transferase